MARPFPDNQLDGPETAALVFSVAESRDNDEIRSMLKHDPGTDRAPFSFEREPDYFAEARIQGGSQQSIIARYQGRIIFVGQCSVRRRFFNRQPRAVGHLGGLRLAGEVAGRYDILRRGYEFFRELKWPEPPDFYFSSIVWNHLRDRQFLERNLAGMPRCRSAGDFVTVLIPVPAKIETGPPIEAGNNPEELAAWLNHNNANYQLAPVWTGGELVSLRPLGMKLENFVITREGGRISACAALWDQRSFRQAVLHKEGGKQAWFRPALNKLLELRGRLALPPEGTPLAQGFLSHLALDTEQPGLLAGLVRSVFPLAQREGIEYLTTGFVEGDRRLTVLRRTFPIREFRSRLYLASWGEIPFQPERLLPSPDAALL